MNLKLVIAPSMSLLVPAACVPSTSTKLQKLAVEAALKMCTGNGIGLALPQVGYNISMMILSSEVNRFGQASIEGAKLELPNNKSCYALVNPKIWKVSEKVVDLFKGEGCLSFPIETTGKVDRYQELELEYENLFGEKYSVRIKDHLATIVQHEMDHLYGVMFPARMKPRERDLIMAKYCAKHAINYDKMDKFMNLMLKNAQNYFVDYKNNETPYEANLEKEIQQVKDFCKNNNIDSEEIVQNIEEVLS